MPLDAVARRGPVDLSCYRSVDETYADLAALADAYPGVAEWMDFGVSWREDENGSGDELRVLVVGNEAVEGKSPFVLVGAMHARELTTAETATRFAEVLVQGYGVDPDITWTLDHVAVHVVPVLNPDGRREVEAGDPWWRKNADTDFCPESTPGVDLNRNSSWFFGGPWASSDPCSETYLGPSASSEPETEAIEDYLAEVLPDQWSLALVDGDLPADPDPVDADAEGLLVSLHSAGGLVLYPWEGSTAEAPNLTALVTLGRKFGFYLGYEVCDTCLSPASGTLVDVAYGEYGVASYTWELGTTFQQDCAYFESTLWPTAREALLVGAQATPRPYRWPAGPELVDLELDVDEVAPGAVVTFEALASDARFDSNGHGAEPSQNVVAVYFDVDADPLVAGDAGSAVDGLFDSAVEGVTGVVDTSGLAPGRHLLVVRAEDAAGNVGPPRAAWLVVSDQIFADDFESGTPSAWS